MTIYQALMAKAAEWPHIREFCEREDCVAWHRDCLHTHPHCPPCQLEALAREVCADAAAATLNLAHIHDGEYALASSVQQDIIGGPDA